ncbi:MAG TPA: alpha/beta hydrolase [Chitinophagales bacterium]|nr:alpha/beta hydrolase [Chitinophagales bacterium]
MNKKLSLLAILLLLIFMVPLTIYLLQPDRIISKERAKKELSSPASHFVTWRNAEVHYTDEGSGMPVLMIHGFGGSYTNFDKLANLMKDKYRVIRIDLPGFGLSDFPEVKEGENYLQDYRDYISFILDTLHIDSVYVIGNSMGGAATWMTAIDHPEKVKKIVLLDPAGYDSEKIAGNLVMFKFKSVRQMFNKGMPLFMSWGGAQRSYFKDSLLEEESVIRNNMFTNRQGNVAHMLNLATSNQFPDESLITKVPCPTLIIWGVQDEIIPVAHAERFHKDIKGSQLELIDQCGHCPMMEEPMKTKELVERFFVANDTTAHQ